jgi:mannose-6-phosphate isomerase-like protein (cupin superfamily)
MSRTRFASAIVTAVLVAASLAALAHAQKAVKFDGYEKMDYVLTVEKQTAGQIGSWWTPFVKANSLDGYCFDLNTLPLADRSQLGDRAKILHVGGAGQLVQVIEIPPHGKTVFHGFGWEGEALFYVLSGHGQTDYKGVTGGLPSNKYVWKKNSLFAIPVDHYMQHTNLDPAQPVRMLAVTGYAINMYPYVAEELRSGRQNPAENAEERARTLAGTTYPGHYVEDLRDHPVAMREARGNRTAFFNMMSTVGHRTHPNVHISELTGPQAFAHKHGNQPMFVILKGAGYDIWSEARDLKEYEASVKAGSAHRAEYSTGTLCGVPGGPHWHQHFSTGKEPLRYLAIVPRGEYEEKPSTDK